MATIAAPAMLGWSAVIGLYGSTAAHWSVLARPLLTVIAIAVLIGVVARLSVRGTGATAVATASIALLVGGLPTVMTVIALGGWGALAYWRRIKHRPQPRLPYRHLVRLTAILLVVVVSGTVAGGAVVDGDLSAQPSETPADTDENRPSIYVLLLDGYPRIDTLARDFSFDNGAWIAQLEGLGFEHHPEAVSPATRTEQSLLAMFAPASDRDGDRRTIRARLAKSSGLKMLALAGYQRVHIASPVVHVNFGGWDRVIDTGQLNEFETTLIQRARLVSWVAADWVVSQYRERFEASLAALVTEARRPGQKAVLAHVMAPHVPFLYDEGGRPAPALPCWVGGCGMFDSDRKDVSLSRNEYRERFTANLEAVNQRVLSAIRAVVDADPEAIVIIASDHGVRHEPPSEEWNRSLLLGRGAHVTTIEALFERLLRTLEESVLDGH